MRSTPAPERGAWATYVRAARLRMSMSQSALAREVDVDRVTVYRWEKGQQRPENVAIIKRIASVLDLDVEEALAAAGLRLDVEPPRRPDRELPMPPELLLLVRKLADPRTSRADAEFIRRSLRALAAELPDEEVDVTEEAG